MEIRVEKLKNELKSYNKLINNYEECMLNLYNVLGQTASYWQDANARRFIDDISKQKINVNNISENLSSISEIYNYIIEKYEKFGEKINFDLKFKNKIMSAFDTYLLSIDKLINDYQTLNLGFYPSERDVIINQKNKIITIKKNTENLKKIVNKTFLEFEEIEKNINAKISKINVEVINQTNFKDYI